MTDWLQCWLRAHCYRDKLCLTLDTWSGTTCTSQGLLSQLTVIYSHDLKYSKPALARLESSKT